MPNRRSIIIASLVGIGALVALSLFVINTLNPIKLVKPSNSLNLPLVQLESQRQASSGADNWKLPEPTSDSQPLFLVVINPGSQSSVPDPQVKISGQASVDAKLLINEIPQAVNSDGSFSTFAPLTPGDNEFVITAVNIKGEEKTQTVSVLTADQNNGDLNVTSIQGLVTDIQGGSFKVTTNKGENITVTINQFSRFLRNYGGPSSSDQISSGNEVEIIGVGTEALVIRNITNKTHNAYIAGTINQIDSQNNKFSLATLTGKTIAVNLAGSSFLASFFKEQQKVWVQGLYDPRNETVTGVKEVTAI